MGRKKQEPQRSEITLLRPFDALRAPAGKEVGGQWTEDSSNGQSVEIVEIVEVVKAVKVEKAAGSPSTGSLRGTQGLPTGQALPLKRAPSLFIFPDLSRI
jgi:hypothetical protein